MQVVRMSLKEKFKKQFKSPERKALPAALEILK